MKTCRKCGGLFPETTEFFYRNKRCRNGLTPRCKRCVNVDNAESHERRLRKNPDVVRAQSRARTKRHYQKNLEECRRKNRERARKRLSDPKTKDLINAKKRAGGAGLTPEEIHAMLAEQGGRCAICRSNDPGSKAGWNLDHCHKSRKVRFILCAHCNRGLGAFRDNAGLMRKAADMLDEFYREDDV